jgi:hypothetical protein
MDNRLKRFLSVTLLLLFATYVTPAAQGPAADEIAKHTEAEMNKLLALFNPWVSDTPGHIFAFLDSMSSIPVLQLLEQPCVSIAGKTELYSSFTLLFCDDEARVLGSRRINMDHGLALQKEFVRRLKEMGRIHLVPVERELLDFEGNDAGSWRGLRTRSAYPWLSRKQFPGLSRHIS